MSDQMARELVAFRIGPQELCIDIRTVREIRGWTAATPLPRTPQYLHGVINLRGAVLPIVDLAVRLGFPAAEPTPRHVIIVAQLGATDGAPAGPQASAPVVGLLVDAVSDILTVDPAAVQPPPAVASDLVRDVLEGLLSIDGRMISLITLTHLLPPPEREAA